MPLDAENVIFVGRFFKYNLQNKFKATSGYVLGTCAFTLI